MTTPSALLEAFPAPRPQATGLAVLGIGTMLTFFLAGLFHLSFAWTLLMGWGPAEAQGLPGNGWEAVLMLVLPVLAAPVFAWFVLRRWVGKAVAAGIAGFAFAMALGMLGAVGYALLERHHAGRLAEDTAWFAQAQAALTAELADPALGCQGAAQRLHVRRSTHGPRTAQGAAMALSLEQHLVKQGCLDAPRPIESQIPSSIRPLDSLF